MSHRPSVYRRVCLAFAALPMLASCAGGESDATGDAAELEAGLDAYMAEGDRAGRIYVAIDGEAIIDKSYGEANADLGIPVGPDTVFGIGSRPIDFTIASILLLEQQGRLSRSDRLGDHYPDAPADRADMTIEQMMTGGSGLPDFPARDGDWDADLGWIDRAEFERRTMATPLLFAPGEGEAHSHWAFGLLAAIVERVSGEDYYSFIRSNFLDPAGMERTGNYGERRDLALDDFAVGRGNRVGLPNIPPNWGPTSWLVLGSGGMYSTVGDLRRFYDYVVTSGVLEPDYAAHFLAPSANVDGSERGFELFSFHDEDRSDQAYVMLTSGEGPGGIMPAAELLMPYIRDH